jgi:hypothetical protein
MGYLLPCGCSEPQIGGLERRYNLVKMMRDQGWPVVPVDLGDVPQKTGPAKLANQQGLIKYRYAMEAMRKIGYKGVGIGEYEANLDLFTVLGEWALNNRKDTADKPIEPRVVASNLLDAEKDFPEMTDPWWYSDVKGTGVRVGITTIVSPTVAARIKPIAPKLRFGATAGTLYAVLKQMDKGGVSLPVLLYQGPKTRDEKKPPTEALACAKAYPQFPLVVCESEEDEPSFRPDWVEHKGGGKTMLVAAGRKGKYVAVVGVWKTGKAANPFELKYERVEMTEAFMTPKDKRKDHPIVALMEDYTKELKDKRYLEKYGQMRHPIQVMPAVKGLAKPGEAVYVGSEACKKCHPDAYAIWKKSDHSHAYQSLVEKAKEKGPDNRQYDPECIVCHVVGFGIKSGFVTAESKTKAGHDLKNVGCEACHGPASVHVANKHNKEWHRRINPWKYLPPKKKNEAIDQFCQKCHDIDNDVTWLHNGFKRKWPFVAHMNPKPKPAE